MRVLGIDTASRATTVALLDTEGDVAIERRDDPPPGARPRHLTCVLELAVAVLADGAVGWADVDRIAVGIGPGTFTGIRIGVASARALAAARELPIVGVSTLQALAHQAAGAAAADRRAVVAVLDARRREVFAAGWDATAARGPRSTARLDPRALAPAALADALARDGAAWLAVGDGAVEFREVLEAAGDGQILVPDDGSELHRVSASAHCRLATGLPPQTPDDIHPEYLRLPDAELARRAAPSVNP